MSSKLPRVAKLLQCANGSSQPWFCRLDDGAEWLVKFSAAGPGPSALLAEFLANGLGRLWGLPIPETQAVWLDADVAQAGTDEFWDVLAGSAGPNLGIRKISNAENVVPELSLPRMTLGPLAVFDTLFHNWDRTALSRNLLRDPKGALWWIDHGSCRFVHALHRAEAPTLPSNHFMATALTRPRDLALLPCPERRAVEKLVAAVPLPWLGSMDMDPSELASSLYDYLLRALGAPEHGPSPMPSDLQPS
jgi:hypothetical protein